MKRLFLCSTIVPALCAAVYLTGVSLHAQELRQSVIRVAAPQAGSTVGRQADVSGTATLKRGDYLWVLARRINFKPLWYPQCEAEVDPSTHEWKATANFGEQQDIGWDFDIGVITVNEAGHRMLRVYWDRAMQTGDWRPVRIPKTSSPPQILRVRKVSH